MRFLKLSEMLLGELMVFRIFPLANVLTLVGIVVVTAVLLLKAKVTVVVWGVVAVLCLLAWYLVVDLRRALASTSWLAAVGKGRLFLRWRPYQNLHWPMDDLQVVEIELERIAESRFISRWSIVSEHSSHSNHCVELRFSSSVDPEPLGKQLLAEQGRAGTRGNFPLLLHSGNVLRIQWQAYPTARQFMRVLESHTIPAVWN